MVEEAINKYIDIYTNLIENEFLANALLSFQGGDLSTHIIEDVAARWWIFTRRN